MTAKLLTFSSYEEQQAAKIRQFKVQFFLSKHAMYSPYISIAYDSHIARVL